MSEYLNSHHTESLPQVHSQHPVLGVKSVAVVAGLVGQTEAVHSQGGAWQRGIAVVE